MTGIIAMTMWQGLQEECKVVGQSSFASPNTCCLSTVACVCREAVVGCSNTDVMTVVTCCLCLHQLLRFTCVTALQSTPQNVMNPVVVACCLCLHQLLRFTCSTTTIHTVTFHEPCGCGRLPSVPVVKVHLLQHQTRELISTWNTLQFHDGCGMSPMSVPATMVHLHYNSTIHTVQFTLLQVERIPKPIPPLL